MEELELTYLPKSLPPGILASPSNEMLDIYVPQSADHPILRIRRSGKKHEITKKQPIKQEDFSSQLETTIPLTSEEFADLEKIHGKRVAKTRYLYEENGVHYEIDVFQGSLKGLILVDIEFNSLEDKSNFSPPDWLLTEVTQEKFLVGGMLCGKSYTEIEGKLKSFGYAILEVR